MTYSLRKRDTTTPSPTTSKPKSPTKAKAPAGRSTKTKTNGKSSSPKTGLPPALPEDADVANKHNALVKEIQTIVPTAKPSDTKARKEVAKNKKGVVSEVKKKGVVKELKGLGKNPSGRTFKTDVRHGLNIQSPGSDPSVPRTIEAAKGDESSDAASKSSSHATADPKSAHKALTKELSRVAAPGSASGTRAKRAVADSKIMVNTQVRKQALNREIKSRRAPSASPTKQKAGSPTKEKDLNKVKGGRVAKA
ncbi:hypothetical protein HDV00_010442 [Rhizophlyctis rosea]|nr:hypothetical protein HDV00_010442 [Rhizophlyctis rosea]